MSRSLWRAYFQNDLERFRGLLGLEQEDSSADFITGHGSSTPKLSGTFDEPSYSKRQASFTSLGPAYNKAEQAPVVTKNEINSRLPPLDGSKLATGLSVLHFAATNNDLPFVRALLEHSSVDVNLQDYESGWTALHRALYFGNISIARAMMSIEGGKADMLDVKDKEGNTTFDLFRSTICLDDWEQKKLLKILNQGEDMDDQPEPEDDETRILDVGGFDGEYLGDETYCWGSNKNLSLGFADGDDRHFPERIQIPRSVSQSGHESTEDAITALSPLFVQDIQMSKFQTAIITTSATENLLVCGFGHGGRLGLGHESTVFKFQPVPLGERVKAVALGQDHTIAVTIKGNVYSWGSGRWGQLGYPAKISKQDEEEPQLTPKAVLTNLRKETIIGAAASRWHTAVHTDTSLYVFGKNAGQLGLVDFDSKSTEFQTTPRKAVAPFLSSKISMLAATERSTAILMENHEVWLLMNHGHTRLVFPFERFPNTGIRITRPSSKHYSRPNHISKITSGGSTIAALSRMGDVFTLNTDKQLNVGNVNNKSSFMPQRIWSLKKRHMAIRDVDVGYEGSVILCTESGSVWERTKRSKGTDIAGQNNTLGNNNSSKSNDRAKDYRFSRVPSLTNIIAVRGNAFGAYAAVRKDVGVLKSKLLVRPSSLSNDVGSLLSFRGAFVSLPDTSHAQSSIGAALDLPFHSDEAVMKWFLSQTWEKSAKEAIDKVSSAEYDVLVETTQKGGFPIPVHKFLLSGRSTVLMDLFPIAARDGVVDINGFFRIVKIDHVSMRLIFDNVEPLSLLIFIYFLYTDRLVALWHQFGESRKRLDDFKKLRTDLTNIAKGLGMTELHSTVTTLKAARHTLHIDLERAYDSPSFLRSGDMLLELEDHAIRVHSSIMCARCPFFYALYRGASGRWLSQRRDATDDDDQNLIRVDMKHVRFDVMRLVLRHIYSDKEIGLFDRVQIGEGGLDTLIDIVLDVLSLANELMLERLAEICQRILGRFVNTRNACQILMSVAECSVTSFKDVCLEYLYLNLETVMENRYLDELDDEMMEEFDQAIHTRQLDYMPRARATGSQDLLAMRYLDLPEEDETEFEASTPVQDGKGRLSSSFRNDFSMSPGSFKGKSQFNYGSFEKNKQNKRRSSRTGNGQDKFASPVSRSTTDLMFDMDEEDRSSSAGHDRHTKSDGVIASGLVRKVDSVSSASGRQEARGVQSSDGDLLPSLASPTNLSDAHGQDTSIPSASNGVPWKNGANMTPKLSMKDIMEQTTHKRTSNISLGLAGSSTTTVEKQPDTNPVRVPGCVNASPAKLSQKERKRLQQQHIIPETNATLVSQPKAPVAARQFSWNAANPYPAPPLKDVLQSQATPPPKVLTQAVQAPQNVNPPVLVKSRTEPFGKAIHQAPTKASNLAGPSIPSTPPRPQPQKTQSATSTPITPQSRHYTTRTPTSPAQTPQSSGRPLPHPDFGMRSPGPRLASSPRLPTVNDFPSLGALKEPVNFGLTLDDIITQQQLEQDRIKGRIPRQSMAEIQQEQEFLSWWDKEAEKLQADAQGSTSAPQENGQQVKRRGNSRKPSRGGGGGRGRGGRSSSERGEIVLGDGEAKTRQPESSGRGRGGAASARGGGIKVGPKT